MSALLTYVRAQGGEDAVTETLCRAGVAASPAELTDPARWVGYDVRIRLFDAATTVLGDPFALFHVGAAPFLYLAQKVGRGRYYRLRNPGIEGYYNQLLTGHRGAYHPLTDGHGQVHGRWAADTAFQQGQDLHLSLDAELQAYAERRQ